MVDVTYKFKSGTAGKQLPQEIEKLKPKDEIVICPEKHELTLDGEYDAPSEKGGGNKLKLLYSKLFCLQKLQVCRNLLLQKIIEK